MNGFNDLNKSFKDASGSRDHHMTDLMNELSDDLGRASFGEPKPLSLSGLAHTVTRKLSNISLGFGFGEEDGGRKISTCSSCSSSSFDANVEIGQHGRFTVNPVNDQPGHSQGNNDFLSPLDQSLATNVFRGHRRPNAEDRRQNKFLLDTLKNMGQSPYDADVSFGNDFGINRVFFQNEIKEEYMEIKDMFLH